LLDALDREEPPKALGLHIKLTHESRLSCQKGLSVGQASVYQMLATEPEHRLYIPLSLLQLLRDLNGKDLPRVPYPHTIVRGPRPNLPYTRKYLYRSNIP
jgi:hypothetical protein